MRRTEASVASRTATVQYLRPVTSQRCPSRPTWARVAPTYSFTKCEAPEPEAGAEQGAAQKLRHGCSAVPRDSGERSPALLNRFVAMGRRLYQHKPYSQERPPPGCSRWLGRPLPSRDKVSEPSYVPVTLARADVEVRARPPSSSGARHSTMCSLQALTPGSLPVPARRSDRPVRERRVWCESSLWPRWRRLPQKSGGPAADLKEWERCARRL